MEHQNIKIGTKVSAINEDISGIVIDLGPEITIETEDGFSMKFLPNELVVEPEKWLNTQDLSGSMQKKALDKNVKRSKKVSHVKNQGHPP